MIKTHWNFYNKRFLLKCLIQRSIFYELRNISKVKYVILTIQGADISLKLKLLIKCIMTRRKRNNAYSNKLRIN